MQLLHKALVAAKLGVKGVVQVHLQEAQRAHVPRDGHHRGLREFGEAFAGLQSLPTRADQLHVEVLDDPGGRTPSHGDDTERRPRRVHRESQLGQELLRRFSPQDEPRPPGLLQQVQEERRRLVVAGDKEELPLQHLQEGPLAELRQAPYLTFDHVLQLVGGDAVADQPQDAAVEVEAILEDVALWHAEEAVQQGPPVMRDQL